MSLLINSKSRTSAFTLIELLVVIAIIGVLVSLTSVGVMKILSRGEMVAARTEISQLEAAIAAAKQNFGGVDELPSVIKLHSQGNLLFNDNSQIAIQTKNFLTKVFGKSWIPLPTQTAPTMIWLGPAYSGSYPVTLSGMEALVFWLGGPRDGNGKFQGFSSNPSTPWDYTNTKYKIKGPFFDFNAAKVFINPANLAPTYLNRWNVPYIYFSSSDYASFTVSGLNGIYPYRNSNNPQPNPNYNPFYPATSYYNPKTFQLISSGPDKLYGPGGYYNPPYTTGAPVFDDISNFSSLQLGAREQ